jgi:hypothetical protein
MTVLSIDLATRRYEDCGFAALAAGDRRPRFLTPEDLGLAGAPEPVAFAAALAEFCKREGVSVLCLDGPQGWKSPATGIAHMRLCERVLNTPGKTGEIGKVKPRTYLGYIQFSIDLFHHLRVRHGWDLLTQDWADKPGRRWLVESFPTAAWRTLGLVKLPAKSKVSQGQLETWIRDLALVTGYDLPSALSHDDLQAAVVLPVARAVAEGREDQVVLLGMDPVTTAEDVVLEGWIASPRVPTG